MKANLKRDENYYQSLKKEGNDHIWYPFTQMQEHMKDDLVVIIEGDGCNLVDIDGNRYIDGVSSLWTNVHGHKNPELDNALRGQLDLIAHSTLLGISNAPAIECAKKLVQLTPEGLTKVFFSDNGSTGIEVALKMAYQYHSVSGNPSDKNNRTKYITFKNAYHGDTIGAVSVGGIDLFHGAFRPLLFETLMAESPYCYRCPLGKNIDSCRLACADDIEKILEEHKDEIIALVIEPLVQGAGGMIVQPRGYLKRVREICNKYNVLMIADEVATGFGKTGNLFACSDEDVIPDIMVVAKGITGGYLPLAATVTTEKVYQAFLGKYEEFKTFFHGHTFTGNPLACAVAVANMNIFDRGEIMTHTTEIISRFSELLRRFESLPHVGDIRQKGVMVGIELVANRDSKEQYSAEERIGHKVTLSARKRGAIIRPLGNVIVLMPPLAISSNELERLCNITFDAIVEVTGC